MTGPELKLVAPRLPVPLRPHHHGALAMLFRFSAGQRRSFALALTMLILEAMAGVFQPYPIGYLVDFLQGKRPAIWFPWIASPQYRTIALLTSAYIVMAAVRSLGDSLAEVFLARAGRGSDTASG